MNNKLKRIILVYLIFSFVFVACSIKEEKSDNHISKIKNKAEYENLNNINEYDIDIEFNPDKKIVKGSQRVTYINNQEIKIDKIYFHLYPNAFRKKETVPFVFEDFMSVYPRGFSEGYINIDEVYIDGVKAVYNIDEGNSTIMEVILPNKIEAGKKISIDMGYEIKIPPAVERFGYGDTTYNFGNWYPVIAVYDD